MSHHLSAGQLANLDLRVAKRRPDPQFAAAVAHAVADFLQALEAAVYEEEALVLVEGGSASRERTVQLIEHLPAMPSLDQLLDAKTKAQRK